MPWGLPNARVFPFTTIQDPADFSMALRLRLILPPVAIPVDGNIQCHICRMDLQPGIDDFHCLGCPHDSAMNVRRHNISRDLLHRMLNSLVAKTGSARLEEPERAALSSSLAANGFSYMLNVSRDSAGMLDFVACCRGVRPFIACR